MPGGSVGNQARCVRPAIRNSAEEWNFEIVETVQSLGFRVQGLGFRVQGLGFDVPFRTPGRGSFKGLRVPGSVEVWGTPFISISYTPNRAQQRKSAALHSGLLCLQKPFSLLQSVPRLVEGRRITPMGQ